MSDVLVFVLELIGTVAFAGTSLSVRSVYSRSLVCMIKETIS